MIQWGKTIKTASIVGVMYSDLLRLDIRKFDLIVEGFNARREMELNDNLRTGHLIAGKIAQAVWASKNYKKPIEKIVIEEAHREAVTADEINARVLSTLQRLQAKGFKL